MGHLVQDLSWYAPTNRYCSDCNELVDVLPTVNIVDQGSCRAITLASAYVSQGLGADDLIVVSESVLHLLCMMHLLTPASSDLMTAASSLSMHSVLLSRLLRLSTTVVQLLASSVNATWRSRFHRICVTTALVTSPRLDVTCTRAEPGTHVHLLACRCHLALLMAPPCQQCSLPPPCWLHSA